MTYLRILLAWALLLGGGAPSFANFAMSPSGTTTAFAIDGSNQGTSLCAAASTECPAAVPINTAGSPLFTSGTPGVVNATLQASATTAIGKVDPNTIATWGLFAGQNAASPTNAGLIGGQFNTSPTTITSGNVSPLQLDSAGNLLVNIKAGGGSGGTALADEGTFTQGTTSFTPAGCLFNSSITNLTSGQGGAFRCTNDRQLAVSDAALLAAAQTNGGTTAHTCSVAGYSELGCLGQIDDDVKGTGNVQGPIASGSTQTAQPLPGGGTANTSEPTKVAAGQAIATYLDLVGKLVSSPYSARENMARGYVALSGTSAGTILAASGSASLKEYITDLACTRNDTGTTAVTITLNDSQTTVFDLPNNGGGGGYAHTYEVPLVVAANTAATATAGTSTTTIHCHATGFYGY